MQLVKWVSSFLSAHASDYSAIDNGRHTGPIIVVCILILAISGCTSRDKPAPVVSLSTKVASRGNLTEITTETYTVEAGDTLFAIAFYSGNDYRDLAKLNKISAPYTITVGQQLALRPMQTGQNLTQNKQVSKIAQNTNNTGIDRKTPRAYGEVKPKIQTNNQQDTKVSGSALSNLNWTWPATGNSTIATVGSDGGKRGLDIKGRLGSEVRAAASGKVVYAGNALKGYGNLVIIKHNNDYLSAYAHNSAIIVSEQSYVKQGQQIATMGSSGASEVMLHFEIRKKGQSVDPFKYLPAQ